jgi:hypothetical protein
VRRVLEFEADFPNDCVEENDDIVVPSGRAACLALRDALVSQGWSAGDVEQYSYHSWEFAALRNDRPVRFLLADLSPKYVATVKRSAWLKDLLRRSLPAFAETLMSLERAVNEIGGSKLRWFKIYDATDEGHETIEESLRN